MAAWLDLASTRQPEHRLDKRFYDEVRSQRASRPAGEFLIPPGTGRAFEMRAGQAFRIAQEDGPQIGTVAFWNANDRREGFSGARTMAAEACFVGQYTRLWSDVPWFRPMMTCLEDTVKAVPPNDEFHHHCVGTHCSPETIERRFGRPGPRACRVSLLEAIAPMGLGERDLHDSITVCQRTHLDPFTGRIAIFPSGAKQGDYVEFYAEMDLLVALAVCPFGDGTADPTRSDEPDVRPLKVEIYDTGVVPRPFAPWTDWRPGWQGHWVPPS